jgi:hypothetical protein
VIDRVTAAGRELVRCCTCHDFAELTGPAEQRDADAAAFAGRHQHRSSDLPPSLEPKPKRSRTP